MGLNETIGLFVVLTTLTGICYWQDRKPSIPGKPRLFPYRFVMLILVVLALATLAHAISLATGNPVMPRRKFGT